MASKVDMKQGGRGWQWLIRKVLIVGVVFSYLFSLGDSAPVRSSTVHPPFTRCGDYRTCDLRTQFCDMALNTCGNCGDFCSQSRIAGDDMATANCKQICGWYYLFAAAMTTTTSVPPTHIPAANQPDELESLSKAVAGNFGLVMLVILVLLGIIFVMMSVNFVVGLKRECCSRRGRTMSRRLIREDTTAHCRSVDDTNNILTSQKPLPSAVYCSRVLAGDSIGDSSTTRSKLPSTGDLRQSSMPVGVGAHNSLAPLLSP